MKVLNYNLALRPSISVLAKLSQSDRKGYLLARMLSFEQNMQLIYDSKN